MIKRKKKMRMKMLTMKMMMTIVMRIKKKLMMTMSIQRRKKKLYVIFQAMMLIQSIQYIMLVKTSMSMLSKSLRITKLELIILNR